jgi:hypothetical protein
MGVLHRGQCVRCHRTRPLPDYGRCHDCLETLWESPTEAYLLLAGELDAQLAQGRISQPDHLRESKLLSKRLQLHVEAQPD